MKLNGTMKSILSVFLILILMLQAQQALAHGAAIDRSVLKMANTTLLTHDDLEAHKAFHKELAVSLRRRREWE